MSERYAVYFAPARDSALWDRASRWLGRDAASGFQYGDPIGAIERPRLLANTISASRYGFHATLRSPMHLHEGATPDELAAVVGAFGARNKPIALGTLMLLQIDGFLAIVCAQQTSALTDFAQSVVEAVEPLRAPLSANERARRIGPHLTARHRELVDLYGYPYVAEHFLFHMTLTDRLDPETSGDMIDAAADWFAPALAEPVVLDRLSVFVEPAPGLPFTRDADFALEGKR